MTKFIFNKRRDAYKTDVNLFFTITRPETGHLHKAARVRVFKFYPSVLLSMINPANQRARNWTVIVKSPFDHFPLFAVPCKGWFTLTTESEAQETLRSSVNQKAESEAESEARRNRSQKDQTSEDVLFLPIPLPTLPSCRFTLDQNFPPIPTPLPSFPSLV